ncbi:MAG: hypothetical protein ABF296_00485 [Oceanococcaceae bacterium]
MTESALALNPAAHLALLASGLFLLVGMLTGTWKYSHMARSADATAPVYVDICHRTALMYAFACLVLQQLATHSGWSDTVNVWAVLVPVVFFALAVGSYALHGMLQDTDNQLRSPHKLGNRTLPGFLLHGFMGLLIVGEIGGTAVLVAGIFMR